MKEKTKKLYHYLLTQFSQASTWRGIILIISSAGAMVSEDAKEAILTFGIMAAGLVGVLFPDQLKDKE